MNFFLEEIDGIKIIRIKEDRLDTNIAPDLKAQLLVLIDEGKSVLLNLEDVQYADSSGLAPSCSAFARLATRVATLLSAMCKSGSSP